MQFPIASLLALVLALASPILATQVQDTKPSPSTCESKTINHITHTLPQQCLRTNWSSTNATEKSVSATATAYTGSVAGTVATSESVSTNSTSPGEPASETQASLEQNGKPEKKDDSSDDRKKAKDESEDDEDLATSSYMSFEEWKAMMLQKSGQDPAEIKARKHQDAREGADTGAQDALDSWGEEGEIALDFDALSGKISQMTAAADAKSTAASGAASQAEVHDPPANLDDVAHYRRPKDAGITCKERFSFSSFDVGATVLKTSPGAKNAKAILVENKDSYMLFKCSQENKFVIVELSEDILVDTVVLANFEFFSSMVRNFRISVSDKYPVKMEKWKDVGTFQARNSRDMQAFLIENPKIWAKYIRIEFLSHYGNEYYCPVSLLRVHGTRMMDSWKEAEAGSDDDESTDLIEGSEEVVEEYIPQQDPEAPELDTTNVTEQDTQYSLNELSYQVGQSPWFSPLFSQDEERLLTCGTYQPTPTNHAEASTTVQFEKDNLRDEGSQEPQDNGDAKSALAAATSSPITSSSSSSGDPSIPASSPTSTPAPASSEKLFSSSDVSVDKPQPVQATTKSPVAQPKMPQGFKPGNATSKPPSKPSTNTGQDKAASVASAAHATPTVQESFFKSVSKRLQFLESNTTLSLQYIEDQSKFLQEALQKMERRQISRVDTFLDNLNNTVLSELRSVRQQYDQIWQSTVLALETQREQSDREIIALSSRLNLLADEVVFQKRMAIFQSVLLLCCLVLVLFSRGVLGGSSLGEQWQQMSSTSQFFHNYIGSPRWPPGSPKGMSPQNAPSHSRRADLRPTPSLMLNGRRAVSGPAVTGEGSGLAPDQPHDTVLYADKMLPLTPTSAVFDSNMSSVGSITPPSSSRTGRAVQTDHYRSHSINAEHTGLATPILEIPDNEDPFKLPPSRSNFSSTESDQMSERAVINDDYAAAWDTMSPPAPPLSLSQEDSYFPNDLQENFASNYNEEGERSTLADVQQHQQHYEDLVTTSSPASPQEAREVNSGPPLLRASSMPEWVIGTARKPLPALPEDSI
ncbi:UNC-like C-terminal-domain-containing protein [Coniella lustricola]|uniref:UNC-like C-terminal-domain-containing protein n=1 Tax=Coniella lustricola TaxID=2025994 RepID=A0A2T3AFK9_9PEZI|nr:UNC-like C-terminal-domain-containing protein [Coniella lustricola]